MCSRLSILMANYNNAAYIEQAVDSVLSQDSANWHLHIRDDASTDNSWNVLQKYLNHPQITITQNSHNLGYIDTLRNLVEDAKNELIAILDSDDFLFPHAVSKVLVAFQNPKQPAFVYTRFTRVNSLGELIGEGFSKAVPPSLSNLQCHSISHWKCFTRKLYHNVGGYDQTMHFAEDYDLICRMEEQCSPFFVDAPCYAYRVLPDTQSRAPRKMALGLLNRSRSQVKAYRRRKATANPCNISLSKLSLNICKTFAFGIRHSQWRGCYTLLCDVIFKS